MNKELVVRQCLTHFSPTSGRLQDEFNQQFEYAIDYTLRKTNTNQCITIHINSALKLKECTDDSSRWGIGPNRTGLMEKRTARCITIDANTHKFFLGDCNLNHFTIRQRLRFQKSTQIIFCQTFMRVKKSSYGNLTWDFLRFCVPGNTYPTVVSASLYVVTG